MSVPRKKQAPLVAGKHSQRGPRSSTALNSSAPELPVNGRGQKCPSSAGEETLPLPVGGVLRGYGREHQDLVRAFAKELEAKYGFEDWQQSPDAALHELHGFARGLVAKEGQR